MPDVGVRWKMKHWTVADIKADNEWRKKEKTTNEWIASCYASYVGDGGPGSVKHGKCPRGLVDGIGTGGLSYECSGCPAKEAFDIVYRGYEEVLRAQDPNNEKVLSNALWLTRQFFDVPTAYMATGEIEAWAKEYDQKKYQEGLKRQRELMGDSEAEEVEEEPPKEEYGQMSLFDLI